MFYVGYSFRISTADYIFVSGSQGLKLAGHCVRHPEEAASNLVLWVPDRGSRGRGRSTGTFIDTLMRDTGLQLEEMHACMQDKGQWRTVVARAGASSRK